MKAPGSRFDRLFLITLIVFSFFVVGLMILQRFQRAALPAGMAGDLPVISQVPDFALTNQAGRAVMLGDLAGKVWIGDIIFTRCAGPCPRMTQKMGELQAALAQDAGIRFVTLTTDPDFDTPSVLARYGEKAGAKSDRWSFLTGPKSQIGRVAIDGLKMIANEKPAAERADEKDLFVHSTMFVLVDKSGRLRAAYQTEGDDVHWPSVKERLLGDARRLAKEAH